MARRRERGPAASSTRRRDRDEARRPSREDQGRGSDSDRRLIAIFVVFFIVIPTVSVVVYIVKFAHRGIRSGSSVHHRGLVKTDISYQEILTGSQRVVWLLRKCGFELIQEHSKASENVSNRHYDYPVLAYITPWNSKGYEMAKIFNSKFTHLSPVWYDLKSQGAGLILEGRHNADKGWMQELRSRGNALILPRVVLEALPSELLRKKKLRNKAIDLIVAECKEMEYDGIVLESWSGWAVYGVLHEPYMRKMALQFIKQLGDVLHSTSLRRRDEQHMQFIYVIGTPHSENLQSYDFGPEDLRSLKDSVDGFSLMTYDFSSPQNPGPNAPLKWIDFVLKLLLGSSDSIDQNLARKVLLGINYYGNDFSLSEGSAQAITGRDYLSLLEKYRPTFQWDKKSSEHFLIYVDENKVKHAVFYPTLMSIFSRLEDANRWGTGISIWEIGQGLDYFFDLL